MSGKHLRYDGQHIAMAENHHHAWKAAATQVAALPFWARTWYRARIPLILLLIILGFYWRLTLTRQYTWLDNPDGVYQVLPWFQFQAAAIHNGELPLWDAHEWGGQPLIGQVQPGTAYPLNWILFSLPLRNGFIRQGFLKWYFLLIHFMAAWFCYLLCRDLNLSRPASVLGGVAFALAGWMGSTDWPQMLNSALWTPLIFLFLFRVMRGYRALASAALAGTFLGMAFLAGHHQIPIFTGLAAAGFWVYLAFQDGRLNRNLWRPLAAFGLMCFLVSALQTFPAWECGKLSLRWVGAAEPLAWDEPVPYDIQTGFGLFPTSVLGIVVPGIARNANPYIGMVLLALASMGVAAAWQQRTVRVFAVLAMGALLFSLAGYSIFHGFLYGLVPMIDKARNPSAAIFIFHFCIVVLSVYALDSSTTIAMSSLPRRAWRFLLAFAALIYVLLLFRALWMVQGGLDADAIAMAALTALILAGVLFGWAGGRLSSRFAYVLIFLLALTETGLYSSSEWRNRDSPNFFLKKIYQDPDVAQFIRQQKPPVRLEIDSSQIPYNFGDWYGMDVLGGYLASMTANVYRVQSIYQGRMLAGTNFYIGAKPIRENQVEVFSNSRGIKIYANPEAFPRAWSVHRAESISSSAQISSHLEKPLSELQNRAFVLGSAPELQNCGKADQIQLVRRNLSDLTIDATMQCKGMVVVGDTYYPGWQATVDGIAKPIYEAYGFVRGVVVDAGRHRIEMRYRPKSVYWGAALTAVGILVSLLIGLSEKSVFGFRLKL